MKRKLLCLASVPSALLLSGYASWARSPDAAREWKAPASAATQKSPVAGDARAVAAGRAVYGRECASRHGDHGKGDGKDGRDLDPPPSDLSSPRVGAEPEGALFWKISTGRRPMPSFRKDLTEEERWQVVQFVRTLTSNSANPAKGGTR